MPKPTDEKLYESVKKDLFKKYVKHSAYRSGLLVQRYKEEYEKNIIILTIMSVAKKIRI